jgi:lipopolysaccharide/colanic/teichoic acid biosynthesis glycosyltransferase
MYALVKRIVDIAVALVALILLLPLLTGEREVFYKQERIGLKNQRFGILKFVTMMKNSPNIGTRSITMPNDPRVLPIGRFLRKTKINELPQIFNVLSGEMSIVGPRPLVLETFEAYSSDIQDKIYNCKPGLTGIGSILFRDEESLFKKTSLEPAEFYRQCISPYKGALELWYQEHRSILTDFKIMFLTAWVILFPKSQLVHRLFPGLPKPNSELVAARAE